MATRALEPEITTHEAFTVLGIPHHTTPEGDLAAFWSEFGERMGEFSGTPIEEAAYAVGYGYDEETTEFTYLTGFRTDPKPSVPDGWEAVDLPPQTYAVFTATMSDVSDVMEYAYHDWLPASDYERDVGPEFEHYGSDFHASDPDSTFTLNIPVMKVK